MLLRTTNRLVEAEPLMRRAANIYKQSLVADHPSTRTVRENLGVLENEMVVRRNRKAPDAEGSAPVGGRACR
jgi:hypothetical protein